MEMERMRVFLSWQYGPVASFPHCLFLCKAHVNSEQRIVLRPDHSDAFRHVLGFRTARTHKPSKVYCYLHVKEFERGCILLKYLEGTFRCPSTIRTTTIRHKYTPGCKNCY